MDEVGLTAKRATIACPVEMPPRMPPAWLLRNTGLPSLPMRISSEFSSPESAAALAVDRGAEAGRHPLSHHFDHRADGRAALAHAVEIVGIERGLPRVGAE